MTLLSSIILRDTLANRPAAGTAGRLFYDSTNSILYRDNGSSWDNVEGTGAGGTTIGRTQLVYRYTVAGADKASIDTGVDTADAGDNVWTGGDVLEVWITTRTDDAAAQAAVDITVNNDSSALYDLQFVAGSNTAASANIVAGGTKWTLDSHGAGGTSGYATVNEIICPVFSGTTFNKTARCSTSQPDAAAGGNQRATMYALGYRSTSAITRLKVAAQSTAKLKVGSQLAVYKRLNA